MEEKGFKLDFIGDGIEVPLPKFSPNLDGAIFENPKLRNNVYLDYIHYTIVMNKSTKQLVFAASNIDQNLHKSIPRGHSKSWNIDSRIDENMQLDNRYYKKNDWDRGHMVQRNNNCWGDDYRKTIKANNDTFFYTNAAFQHKFFNQDEWLKLEKFIGLWEKDSNGKLCVFTGPVHLPFDRQYARSWHDTVRIPSAFFKIVCYKSITTNQFETRAFILYQDNEFIGNKKKGASYIKLKNYQVTITEIEELTGLEFDKSIVYSNPLYYTQPDKPKSGLTINNFPERIPIDIVGDIVNAIDQPRHTQEAKDEDKLVIIAAAMVNPSGAGEWEKEWITLLNVADKEVNLKGWFLQDHLERKIKLKGTLEEGHSLRLYMKDFKTIRLPNTGGTIILKNNRNEVIDRETYTKEEVKIEDKALRF